MRIAFGLIVRSLDYTCNINMFLKNCQKYGHKIDECIIVYQDEISKEYADEINKYTRLKTIKIDEMINIQMEMSKRGVREEEIKVFTDMPEYYKFGRVPYGKNRNLVLVQALLDKMDYLFFVDDDVESCILKENLEKEEIDFVGEHLRGFVDSRVIGTTSDYSGHYILPSTQIEGFSDYLDGLQKKLEYEKIHKTTGGKFIIYGNKKRNKAVVTSKVLGGNLCFKLSRVKHMPPFYSSLFKHKGQAYLMRGEDTVLGNFFENSKYKMMDIDLKIFHNTYNDFPKTPDLLSDSNVKDRLFYASMGWIGRNPFLNHVKGNDVERLYKYQKQCLRENSPKMAKELNDDRFLIMPEAIDSSYSNLGRLIEDYEKTERAWRRFAVSMS